MSPAYITCIAVGAVLVFWIVGAYNRLVALRSEITRRFPQLDTELQRRHALLDQWVTVARPLLDAPQAAEAVSAADGQVRAALDAMRPKPLMPREATTLRLAEDTLSAARLRLLAEAASVPADAVSPELSAVDQDLGTLESTLAYARRHFNDASAQYNAARDQFPTWLVAGLFGFRPAGTL